MKKFFQTVRTKKIYVTMLLMTLLTSLFTTPAYASGVGDKAVEAFQSNIYDQITAVVRGIVLPIVNLILVVVFIIRIAGAYKSYHTQGGQIDWSPIVIVFLCLCVTVTANIWMWGLIGG